MKSLKFLIAIFLFALTTSCVTTLPLSNQFYNSKKVEIIFKIDSIGIAKSGSQGLLDMALTPGSRFKKPLQDIEPNLKLIIEDTIKTEISDILNNKKKQFDFITEKFDYNALEKFDNPKSNKKYAKKDFRNLKSVYNVDEIMYVKVKYGLLISYYGTIETGKQGFVNIETQVIDLSDNSLLQHAKCNSVVNIIGKWDKGESYENLKKSIREALNNSIRILKTKF